MNDFLGYNKLVIALKDQENITFTCPYAILLPLEECHSFMQCTDHLSTMYIIHLLRHGYVGIYGWFHGLW